MSRSQGETMRSLSVTTRVYFIKLGRRGCWEPECLANGVLHFSYRETPQSLCVAGDWDAVKAFWAKRRGNEATASSDVRQIRTFFEASEADLFITFSKGYLWWCHPADTAVVVRSADGVRVRQTVDGWHRVSIGGEPLLMSRLSGKLTKTQMYRGTICEVDERAYLLRRINDQKTPEVVAVEATEQVLLQQILDMTRLLTPEDFELMVELVFSYSGWQRQSRTGGTQKTIDLDLLLPSTCERAFVQVKSSTDTAQFDSYAAEFAATDAHARMFYVWHTGTVEREPPAGVILWGPNVLGDKVLGAGLLGWLKDRVS